MRQRVWDWYANDLYTRLSAEAWIVLTHTRWHRDDLAGRLLRKMADRAADQWEILCLPAVLRGGRRGRSVRRSPAGRQPWPESPLAGVQVGGRPGDHPPAGRQGLRRLVPAGPGRGLARPSGPPELFGDWIWVPPEKWPQKFDLRRGLRRCQQGPQRQAGRLLARSSSWASARDRLLYVDAILERIPLDQIVRKTIVFCDEKRPDFVGIEAEQFQELLVHEFRRQCGEQFALRWPIYQMMTQGVAKVARIRRLSQYVINRELRFKADSPGCRLLVDQLMDFPLAEHDDGPDALEMCMRLPLEV